MPELVKFTTGRNTTRGRAVGGYGGWPKKATRWGPGVTVSVPEAERGNHLCTNQVIHAYPNLDVGLLCRPSHGVKHYRRAWRAETPVVVVDDGSKVGVHELTTVELLEKPAWWRRPSRRIKVLHGLRARLLDAEVRGRLAQAVQKRNTCSASLAEEYIRSYLGAVADPNFQYHSGLAQALAEALAWYGIVLGGAELIALIQGVVDEVMADAPVASTR